MSELLSLSSSSRVARFNSAVMQLIADTFRERFPDTPMTIEDIVSDFELAMMAIPDVIPEAEARGCWFHYGQAVIKKAGKLRLTLRYRHGGVVNSIIQELIALAILPPDRIYEGFENVRQAHARLLLRQSRATQRAVGKLYRYWTGYWLGVVTPLRFSCHGHQNRTNNFVEAWHRWFNKRCIHSHLNIWNFIDQVKDAENSKSRDFEAAEAGLPIGRGTTKQQQHINRKIARYTTMLEDGLITLREFLERTRKSFNVAPRRELNEEDERNEESDVGVEEQSDEEMPRQRRRVPAGFRRRDRNNGGAVGRLAQVQERRARADERQEIPAIPGPEIQCPLERQFERAGARLTQVHAQADHRRERAERRRERAERRRARAEERQQAESPVEQAESPEEPFESPEEQAESPEEPAEGPEEPAESPEEPAESSVWGGGDIFSPPVSPFWQPESPLNQPESPLNQPESSLWERRSRDQEAEMEAQLGETGAFLARGNFNQLSFELVNLTLEK